MNKLRGLYLFFVLATFFVWIKSYIAFRFEFTLDIENTTQELILLITPLSSILFIMGFGLAMKGKKAYGFIIATNVFLTLMLWANLLFYRFFNDFVTLPVLFQTKNASAGLGESALSLMRGHDVLYFMDILILLVMAYKQRNKEEEVINYKKTSIMVIAAVLICISFVNLSLAEKERPQLLTRTFDRQILVKLLGLYNYQVYDVFLHTKSNAQRALADSNDLVQIVNYANTKKTEMNPEMFGIAKGKNLVVVSLESTQNFIIDYKINNQEVTPFLNKLAKESYYFNNFYHQTAQGKTSDSEFLLENSYYGLPRGAVFSQKPQNTYNGLANVLGDHQYETAVFHGNNKSFWNRDVIYPKLGIQKFFDAESYVFEEGSEIGYGLKDKPFFEQSVDLMKTLKQPYYSRFITLTNHYPYIMDEEDVTIEPHQTGDKTVDGYFQTIRYQDEALEQFFNKLKKEGMYENTVFVLYGDHYGNSKNRNKAMEVVIGKEINDFESLELQEVPLIVHIPGQKGAVMPVVGGQVDLKPTILHLLGVDTSQEVLFGQDLFAHKEERFVIHRDGSVVTENLVLTEGSCYQKADGLEVDVTQCAGMKEKAEKELAYSDKLVYGDLLRFDTEGQLSEEALKEMEEEMNKMEQEKKQSDSLTEEQKQEQSAP